MQTKTFFPAVILLVIPIFICASSSQEKTKFIKGEIVSQDAKSMEGYRMFFGGYKTLTDREGFFTFPLDSSEIKPFYLVISRDTCWNYGRTNTISTLCQDRNKPYLFFTINYQQDQNGNESLDIKQTTLDAMNFTIPSERCILAPIHPKYVKYVEAKNSILGQQFLCCPKITLREEASLRTEKINELQQKGISTHVAVNEDRLKRLSNKSVLQTIENTPFHETTGEVKRRVFNKCNRPVEISLIQ